MRDTYKEREDASGNFHLADVTPSGTLEANKIDGGTSNWLGWTTIGSSLAGANARHW